MSFGATNKIVLFLHLCSMFYFSNLALYFLFRGRGRFAGHGLGYLVIPVNETVLDRGLTGSDNIWAH